MKSNDNIIGAFSETIDKSFDNVLCEICDSPVTELIGSSIFNEIPLFRTLISSLRVTQSFRDYHHLRKISLFIKTIENDSTSEKLDKYRNELKNNSEKSKNEIDYVLVLLDRYLEDYKSIYAAKLFVSYLDHKLDWEQFVSLTSSLDRLTKQDIELLNSDSYAYMSELSNKYDSVSRLEACGFLYRDVMNNATVVNDSFSFSSIVSDQKYRLTMYGTLFLACLFDYMKRKE